MAHDDDNLKLFELKLALCSHEVIAALHFYLFSISRTCFLSPKLTHSN